MTWTTRQRSDIGGSPAIVAGSGVPVLLLHGVGLRAEAWAAQIDGLAGAARITAPDMPGHGANTRLPDRAHLDAFVESAAAVLCALDGPAVVAGHSMGAMIALELAARLPERVRAVAALNAVHERSASAAEAVRARAAQLDGRTAPDPEPTLTRWFGSASTSERRACATWLRAAHPAGYKMAYTTFAESLSPSRALLADLHCPALFATGRGDPNATADMAERMAATTPRARTLIVENAAHMMPMTHAAEINAALGALLHGSA